MQPDMITTTFDAITERSLSPVERRTAKVISAPLVDTFLAGRKQTTLNTYSQGLEDFRVFTHCQDVDEAARLLITSEHGNANALVLAYRANLIERKLAAATVNNRLAALRSLVKLAGTLGLVSWKLEVENVKATSYRDTKGPGTTAFRRMVDELDSRMTAKSKRDRAAVRLLHDLALRREEVVSLDVEDVDLESGTVSVVRKGYTETVKLEMPTPTKEALAEWLEARGVTPGPLFVNFDRSKKGRRLTGTSLYRIVRDLGAVVGAKTRPHGLRHTGITTACERAAALGIGIEEVLDFSGHRNVKTLMIYRDRNRNMQGKLAALVAAEN